jgi:hypothetical protein
VQTKERKQSSMPEPPSDQNADQAAPGPEQAPPRRLVVELTRSSAAHLARLVEEEDLNKTTIVNRALTVYAAIRSAEKEGDKLLVRDGKTGELMQLKFV